MDRDALARAARKRQAEDALQFERDREVTLAEQLEETLAEAHGAAIDDEIFAGMPPEDAAIVRDAFQGPAVEVDEEGFEDDALSEESDQSFLEDEITRLQEELAACRRRQQAFERYLAGLGKT